ncbi:YbaB/EbfC family nucleoid-associated protein [Nonomuraea sp. NPDC050643]|uniref:YbaB/EbfC family nucleoid-associated protein n=1 Tax=Nonomuraea sp. NPDC050643 TaxID=3155660 RepID=UPI0033E8A54C
MSGDLGAGDFDRLIEGARQAVESARTVLFAPTGAEYEANERDGLVRATAVLSADGARLRSLDLNPRARRLESADLAALILRTVNEALDGVAGETRPGSAPDLAALSAELSELQEFSADRFGVFADTITDLLRQLERRIDG